MTTTSFSNSTRQSTVSADSLSRMQNPTRAQATVAAAYRHTPYASRGGGIATPQHPNLVSFTSPSGGIGLSTITALVALTLSSQDVECALLDVDIPHGGMGILLGIEHEPGLSLQDIDAPLGQIDGKALNLELPHWEDVNVLASATWRGSLPEWWQIQAAIQALCEANQIVLADAGDGAVWEYMPELLMAQHVIAVELSVLGLARAKAHLSQLQRLRQELLGGNGDQAAPIVVLTEPRGAPLRSTSSAIAVTEAIAYLGGDALGPIQHVPRLCADILEGLGIGATPRCNRPAIEALSERVLESANIRA